MTPAPAPAALPITGVDAHAHVFHRGLPLAPGRRYTLDYDATAETYIRHLDAAGLSHGVLVQPSFLGSDNGYMVEALRRYPDRLRGIAAVAPGVAGETLDELAAAGVVGVRFNLIGLEVPDWRAQPWAGLLRKLADRDWLVEIHRGAGDLPRLLPPILGYGLRVVVNHYGRPDPALCAADPGFRGLLDLARVGQVWVKLSAPYRADADRAAEAEMSGLLRQAFGPERLLWGSDWPHTQFEARASHAGEFAALDHRVPDAGFRRRVLVETPARLYGFA